MTQAKPSLAQTPQSFSSNGFGMGLDDEGQPCMYMWVGGPVGQYGRVIRVGQPVQTLTADDVRIIVRDELDKARGS